MRKEDVRRTWNVPGKVTLPQWYSLLVGMLSSSVFLETIWINIKKKLETEMVTWQRTEY